MSYKKKMSFSDYSLSLLESDQRPLDFVITCKLPKPEFTINHLYKGAKIALSNFPISNCRIKGKYFVEVNTEYNIEIFMPPKNLHDFIEEYSKPALDIFHQRAILQAAIEYEDHFILITRFHHAIGDFLSLFHWLNVQLTHNQYKGRELSLKVFDGKRPVKTPFCFKNKAKVIANLEGKVSANRGFQMLKFPKPSFDFKSHNISYNDFLSAVMLDTLYEYNCKKGIGLEQENALYLPMNIRKYPFEGFGNGSSRIKVYNQYSQDNDLIQKAVNIRHQVKTCTEIGFWAMPEESGFFGLLPRFIAKFLLNKVGMKLTEAGSFIFSHVSRFDGFEQIMPYFEDFNGLSQMHEHYAFNTFILTFNGQCHLSMTWDKALLTKADISIFSEIFLRKINEIKETV